VKDSLHAYQLSKRGNALRVMAEAVRWAKRGARVNAMSPGIIISPTAKDQMSGPQRGGLPTHDRVLPGRPCRHSR
jgi:NAD(P)-dependent dehydrogenase (short-subunit alcohol dehydrogenase family)